MTLDIDKQELKVLKYITFISLTQFNVYSLPQIHFLKSHMLQLLFKVF